MKFKRKSNHFTRIFTPEDLLKQKKQCLDYLKDINTPKLTTQRKMVCEGKLTVKKCSDTLLTMSNGKRLGNNGLTKELYVCFWEDLAHFLLTLLNMLLRKVSSAPLRDRLYKNCFQESNNKD